MNIQGIINENTGIKHDNDTSTFEYITACLLQRIIHATFIYEQGGAG